MKKKFISGIVVFILCYVAGVVLSFVVEKPENIGAAFSGMYALMGLALGGLAFLLILLAGKNYKTSSSTGVGTTASGEKLKQYFDARWVTEKELLTDPKFMYNTYNTLPNVKKSGIVIRNEVKNGKLNVNMYNPIHTLVIGTTGSGKTTMIIDPAIRILSRTGEKPCLVVTDPKGELYNNHSLQLKANGYRLLTLDLRNPYASTRWNPMSNAYEKYHRAMNLENEVVAHKGSNPADLKLKIISKQYNHEWYEYNGIAYPNKEQLMSDLSAKKQELIDQAENELREIAVNIVPIENKNDPSWERGAQDFLYGLMIAMLEDSLNPELGMTKEKFNFYNLAKIATYRDPDPDNPFGTIREYCSGRDKLSKVQGLVSTVINNAPNTTRSYMGVLLSRISIFQDGGICYATSYSDMLFDDFVDKPTALFIKVPDEKESRHCIATMCISQLYKKLIEIASEKPDLKLPKTVYFLLDEFANLPKIEKMDSIITVARSRKIFFELVVQSYSQLDNKYGKEVAETIRGNCNIQIFLGTEDQKTKEEFSKMCGDVSIETKNTSVSRSEKKDDMGSSTTSSQVVTRPLIYPYELGQLPYGTAIVKIFQVNPIKVAFTQYFKVPEFDKKIAAEEYAPSHSLNETAIYYDITERNKKVYKKSSSSVSFDDFDF